jgi:hypothetical protein
VDYDRGVDGTWSAASETPVSTDPTALATEVSAAQVSLGLQVAIVLKAGVYHSIRHEDGNWDPFANLAGAVPSVPGKPVHVAVTNWPAPFDDELQLVYTTDTGALWHTIRFWNGTWQALGDVAGAAGPVTAGTATIAGNVY